jgi:hypothetical protein
MAKKPKPLPSYKFAGSSPTNIPKDEKRKPGVCGQRKK